MKNSSKALDVFDFKEEDELPEAVASRFCNKVRARDNYSFLQNVSESDCNANGDLAMDEEDFTEKGFDDRRKRAHVSHSPVRHRSASPVKLHCSALQESPSNDEAIGVLDDDRSISERSPSTSTATSENHVSGDGASDCSSNGLEMGEQMVVVFHSDYFLYRERYCTDATISFSGSYIEVKGSTAYESQESFSIQFEIDDIVGIESQWFGRCDTAMVKISAISKNEVHNISGIEELKFAVTDCNWYERQEEVETLNVKYKALWNVIFDTEVEVEGDSLLEKENLLSCKSYFPRFDNPCEEVIYPKGDPDAVSISKRDFDLLEPDTFVNDTIIDFYIKYLKNTVRTEEMQRFHFFNSFFFRKLADMDKNQSSAFESRAAFLRVRKWTRKVNLFEKDFIFIPVNYNYHWSLIIVCHPGEVATFEDDEAEKPVRVPCILHMDSLRGSHKDLKDIMQSYLWEEWKERQKDTSEDVFLNFSNMRFISLELPQQQNLYDCGLFLLHYVELFLEDAPSNFSPFKAITEISDFLTVDWFPPDEASLKRRHIQKLISDLLESRSQDNSSSSSDNCCTSNSPKANNDNENMVEFLPEKSSLGKGVHQDLLCSQAGQGVGLSPFSASSLGDQHAEDRGLDSRELLEPGPDVGSLMDVHFQAFGRMSFNGFKDAVLPIEEEVEEDGHFVYTATETGVQNLEGIPVEACVPYSENFRADGHWNPRIAVDHSRCQEVNLSLGATIFEAGNSSEVEVDEQCQVDEEIKTDGKVDPLISSARENIDCSTNDNVSPYDGLLVSAKSECSVEKLEHNDNADHTPAQYNISQLSCQVDDIQENGNISCDNMELIGDDSTLDADLQRAPKKLRLTSI